VSNGWFCGSKAVVWVQAVSNVNARSARNALAKTLHIERGREGRSSLSPAITFSPNVALNTIEKLPPRLRAFCGRRVKEKTRTRRSSFHPDSSA